jgi:hypothetical protein
MASPLFVASNGVRNRVRGAVRRGVRRHGGEQRCTPGGTFGGRERLALIHRSLLDQPDRLNRPVGVACVLLRTPRLGETPSWDFGCEPAPQPIDGSGQARVLARPDGVVPLPRRNGLSGDGAKDAIDSI